MKASLVFLVGFAVCLVHPSLSQDQNIADSLMLLKNNTQHHDTIQMQILRGLAYNESNLKEALSYAEELIELAEKSDNSLFLYRGNIQKGYKLSRLGNTDEALKAFIHALNFAKKENYLVGEGTAYSAIADLYSNTSNYSQAFKYYQHAIQSLERTKDSKSLASIFLNIGDMYLTLEEYDSALFYFDKSGKLYNKLDFKIGIAYNLGNTGMVYANLGNYKLAEKNMNQAIGILTELGDYYPVCFYLISISDIFKEKGDVFNAQIYADKSLRLALKYHLKQQISDANQKLSELHELNDDSKKAFHYYKNYIAFRDSVTNLETVRNLANQRTEFEVNLRETAINSLEKDKKLQQTYIIVAVILLILSIVVVLYFLQRFRNTRIMAELQQKEHGIKINNLLKNQETLALQAMIRGKEEERKHLAKELHNHLGSLLATVKVNLNGLESPDQSKYQTIIHLVDQATQDVRNISHELNMGVSENFGLLPALKELVKHLQKVNDIKVTLSAVLDAVLMDAKSEILVYRIVQELVSNVLKHADATVLSISLTGFEEGNLVNVLVEDNGKGFEPSDLNQEAKGIGLDSLQEMIQKLDGDISIDSRRDIGTTISIDLPLEIPETNVLP